MNYTKTVQDMIEQFWETSGKYRYEASMDQVSADENAMLFCIKKYPMIKPYEVIRILRKERERVDEENK